MRKQGNILNVVSYNTGDFVAVDSLVGATVLTMESVYDFQETGGTAVILSTGQEIVYTSTDPDQNLLYLDAASALTFDVTEGDKIEVTPFSVEKRAFVDTGDVFEALDCRVPFNMQAILPEGIRTEETSYESVAIDQDGAEWVIAEIYGQPAKIDGAYIDPDSTIPIGALTDGIPPSIAPVVSTTSIPGFGQLRWAEVTNEDPIQGYKVYVSSTPGFVADDGINLAQIVGGTLALIRTLPGGGSMTPTTTYYAQVRAFDADGDGPLSAEVSFTPGQAGSPDIAVGSVSASMLQSVLNLSSMFVGKNPPQVLTNKELTSNVATLTTATPHNFTAGAVVLITGVDTTFNGIQTITAIPSATTFSFAKIASDVSSTPTTGLADPSQRWEGDSAGIRFYDTSGDIVINLPTNASPENPASFYGSMVAVGLRVLDNLSIQGTNNEIAAGGKLTMKSGITKPSLAPSPTIAYRDGISWQYNSTEIDPTDYNIGLAAVDFDGTNWWGLRNSGGDLASDGYDIYLDELPTGGGVPTNSTLLTSISSWDEFPKTLFVIGDYAFISVYDGGGRWFRYRISTGVTDTSPEAMFPLPAGATVGSIHFGLGADRVNGYLIRSYRTSAGKLGWRTYDPSTGTVITTYDTGVPISSGISLMQRVSADFGSDRFIVPISGTVNVYSTASTPILQTNETFPYPNTTYTVFWNGTRFVSPNWLYGYPDTDLSPRLFEYSQNKWTTETNKWWLGSTIRLADGTGPDYATYETDLGAVTGFTMTKRAFLTASVANNPPSPADAVTFYVGRLSGLTKPAVSAVWRQPTVPAVGIKTQTMDSVAFTGTAVVDNPPLINTFPGGSPSKFEAQNGGFNVDSESAGSWDKRDDRIIPTTTDIAASSTATIVAKWALPAGYFSTGRLAEIVLNAQVSATATITWKVFMGPLGTNADPVLVTYTTSAANTGTLAHAVMDTYVRCIDSGHMAAFGFVTNGIDLGDGVGAVNGVTTNAAVDTTVPQFLSVEAKLSTTNSLTINAAYLEKKRG